MKAMITFLGEPESNIASTTWGNDATGRVEFPLKVPVLVDPETASGEKRRFLEHIIHKARGNAFFKVNDDASGDDDAEAATIKDTPPRPRTTPNRKRGEK